MEDPENVENLDPANAPGGRRKCRVLYPMGPRHGDNLTHRGSKDVNDLDVVHEEFSPPGSKRMYLMEVSPTQNTRDTSLTETPAPLTALILP